VSAYLLFGYPLGDLNSPEWHKAQASRFGEEELAECGGAFSWLTRWDAYQDLPNTVARKVLEAWYTPGDIAEVDYPWTFLQQKKLLTVERVGWCEDRNLVLASYPFLQTRNNEPAREVRELFLTDAVRRTLMQAYKALNLGPDPIAEDIRPKWLLCDESGY
jgi:hypothetical protein